MPNEVILSAEGFSRLEDRLRKVEEGNNVELLVANSIWVQRGFRVLDSFKEILAEYYGSGVFLVDFGADQEKARQQMNEWARTPRG